MMASAMQRGLLTVCGMILVASLATSSPSLADQIARVADRATDKAGVRRIGPRTKADTHLARALEEYSAHVSQGKSERFEPSSKFS